MKSKKGEILKVVVFLAIGLVSVSVSKGIDPKLDTLFKISDLERILPLAYVSVTQIHPAISTELDAVTIKRIEDKLKSAVPQDVFTSSIQKEFKIKYSERFYANLKAIYLDQAMVQFSEAKKQWNSPDGQKNCAEQNSRINKNASEEKKAFTKKYIDRESTLEKTLDLFDMALEAQIDLINELQPKPNRLTKVNMQELAKKYRSGIISRAKEGMAIEFYCLFDEFSIEQLNRIFEIEGKKEVIWFDDIVWKGLRQGYQKSKISIGN